MSRERIEVLKGILAQLIDMINDVDDERLVTPDGLDSSTQYGSKVTIIDALWGIHGEIEGVIVELKITYDEKGEKK